MAVVAFDPLEYAQQLEAAGMPRDQAVVVAKGLCSMFVHNFDALVTKDYLDVRFNEFETRIEAKMDRRFAAVESRFSEMQAEMDSRFSQMQASMDRYFANVDARLAKGDERFVSIDERFLGIEKRMVSLEERIYALELRMERLEARFGRMELVQAIILAALVIPVAQTLLTWWG